MKYSGIGGQAVIEGIMMMKGEDYAVAVRRPDKEIEVKKDTYQSITKKAKILQLPFVRGVFRFADSMIIGMRSLTYSASFFEDDEDAEPGKPDAHERHPGLYRGAVAAVAIYQRGACRAGRKLQRAVGHEELAAAVVEDGEEGPCRMKPPIWRGRTRAWRYWGAGRTPSARDEPR